MIKYAPKIVKSKYYVHTYYIYITYYNTMWITTLCYFTSMYRFVEDRSLTEYDESPRKVESQNRLASAR